MVAESDALRYLLAEPVNPSGTPVADQIIVSEGMEVALATCLGADLSLPYDSGDTGYWRQDMTVPTVEPPAYGTPFARFITQSDVLKQALSGVSLIENIKDIEQAQKSSNLDKRWCQKTAYYGAGTGWYAKGQQVMRRNGSASARGWMRCRQKT